MNARVSFFVLLSLVHCSGFAAEINDSIDSIFSAIDDVNSPGCTVGVIEGGELVHRAGYGLANIELGVKLDGSHVHRMGSVSKQFTAMAVLLLAEEYELDLNDDIREQLPELRSYGSEVSINAILGHVAGMGDYELITAEGSDGERVEGGLNLRSVAGGSFRLGNQDYLTNEEFYSLVKTLGLKSPPLEKLEYSNMGYVILTLLVETVSGESLREFSDKRIFKPLNMSNTFFSDDPVEIIPNRASGYRPQGEDFVTDMTNLFWVGDGGLHTNLDDMLKWDQNFYDSKLGQNPEAIMTLFLTPNSELKDDGRLYANGQFVSEYDGAKIYSHSGGWLGTSTLYARIPNSGFSSVIMCNDVSQSPTEYWLRIVDEYLQPRL
jgi:CubicO group peptidase (beta-lactamase class C family)|tara:strand:+ start:771 stop:1904 length:1134 start_codon:yes stop_codon:yes gene_type:complete